MRLGQSRALGRNLKMATGEIKAIILVDGVTVTAGTASPLGLGGAGAVGGSWYSPDGTGAPQSQIGSEKCFLFPDASDNELWLTLLVPSSYQAGDPIALDLGYTADSTSLTIKLKATTYLVPPALAFSATTNSYSSTNAAITNASPAQRVQKATLDLTSSTGTINAVAVAAGDVLRVKLTRDYANDTDTGIAYVIPSASLARFTA
jgi:hypothetical protein